LFISQVLTFYLFFVFSNFAPKVNLSPKTTFTIVFLWRVYAELLIIIGKLIHGFCVV